jgi:hypothetical protein
MNVSRLLAATMVAGAGAAPDGEPATVRAPADEPPERARGRAAPARPARRQAMPLVRQIPKVAH